MLLCKVLGGGESRRLWREEEGESRVLKVGLELGPSRRAGVWMW